MLGYSRRGQPLIALALIIGGWVSARAVMWEPDAALRVGPIAVLDTSVAPVLVSLANRAPQTRFDAGIARPGLLGLSRSDAPVASGETPVAGGAPPSLPLATTEAEPRPAAPQSLGPQPQFRGEGLARPLDPLPPPPVFAPVPAGVAAGHQLLWMASLAHVPMPAALAGLPQFAAASTPTPFFPAGQVPLSRARRWSADGWVLWRRGSAGAPAGGLLTPSYGASQAGVVLRYRLAPGSGHRPAAYLRATAALNGSNEREAALGLSARPFGEVPVSLAAEARFTSTPGSTMVRPAAFAVTELPPFALPLGLRGEAYGQAGFVGGRFATAFADGQLRVDRRLTGLGKGDVRLGGGIWGGIQKGASRIDAGPSLTLGQPLGGPASLRLAADWRFRVAGKASPGSGPAVTLSAGF